MTPNRTTLYRRPDGAEMTSQEKLAFLLDVAPRTIWAYRKPSSTRNVPDTILSPIERHVLARLTAIVTAAGYELRRAA